LALTLHEALTQNIQDKWRHNQVKENQIKRALLKIIANKAEVERIFKIIFQQEEY
jgi:type I restriction enzyme R subunit